MSRNLPIALAAGLVLPALAALLAPAQEPKREAVPQPPAAAKPAGLPFPLARELMKAQAPPDPARPATPPPPPSPPTEPTRVALDFPGRPVAQVIRTLAERTGGMVDTFNTNDARLAEMVTLTSPAPVPFWEAIDRLASAANLTRSVTPAGPFGNPPPRVQFSANLGHATASASAADDGLIAYIGPFRVGPLVVHEHFSRVFHQTAAPAYAKPSPSAPPFYAEVGLMAEPDLLAIQHGPLHRVEAVDDAGRSLLDPKLSGEVPYDQSPSDIHGPPRTLRVPLVRAGGPSKALATLRAALPLEVARRPTAPTLVVTLEGSSGKTFRDGDMAIDVREYRAAPQGTAHLKLAVRIEGKRGEPGSGLRGVVDARLWSVFHRQMELVDAQGKPINGLGGGSSISGDGVRELSMTYNFTAHPGTGANVPAQIRIYRASWVAWELPLEFRDVPLP